MAHNKKTAAANNKKIKQNEPFIKDRIIIKTVKLLKFPLIFIVLTAVFYWPILSAKGFLWNDFIDQNFPYRIFAAVSLKSGTFPFWNPYVFSGMPFFADVQAAVLYPANLILTLFASKEWLNPLLLEYQIIFHLFLAGLSMYLMCREFGCIRWGSLFSGISFMFCGFLTTHIFHVNLIHTAAWFPLIILLFKRMLDRKSLLYCCLCSLTIAATFLSGYPQLILHMYYWLAAYFLFRLFTDIKTGTSKREAILRSSLFAACVVLSIGMASIQLIPTKVLGDNSARPSMSFTESCEGSFRPYRFVTLLMPKIFGTPDKIYWGIAANDVNAGVHSYWETAIYCGIPALILALLAAIFIKNSAIWFFSGMGILALLLTMGDSLFVYQIFFNLLPGLNRFRIPARFAYIFSISISLLAGFGLQWIVVKDWLSEKKIKPILERILLIVPAGFLLLGIAVSSGAFRHSVGEFMINSGAFGNNPAVLGKHIEQSIYPNLVSSYWIFLLFLILTALTVILRMRRLISARTTGALCCLIIFLDLLIFGYGYAARKINPEKVYAKTGIVRELQKIGEHEFFRINSRDSSPGTDDLGGRHMIFQKNQGSVHRLFLMEGYNPLRLKRQLVDRKNKTLDILNVKYYISEDKRSLALNQTYLPRARMVYDYIVEPEEEKILATMHSGEFDHNKTAFLEESPGIDIQPVDTTGRPGWSAEITDYSLNKIELDVTSEKNGLLILSEIYYPAWKAMVDDTPSPVLRADYALRAVSLKAGKHRVVLSYTSDPFKFGMTISIISLLLTLTIIIFGYLKLAVFNKNRSNRTAVSI